ncbi:MAG: terminase large subunit [Clostridium beijerinckii]|nr:terminase large subunit [Clostridium beijerinckii]
MIFNKYIDEYIDLVENKKVVTNEDIKKSIKLVKNKLSQPNVIIDHEKIEKAILKIEEYFPFKLLPWEKFIIGLSHCYYEDDTLVFDTFILYMGRGAGKNGFISTVSWYLTTSFHGIKEYNVDIVANCEDQAKTSFEDVYNIIEDSKKLQKAFYYTKEKIVYKRTRSYIKYHTSNARTKDGLRPACIIFDEIHEYENYNNIKVFKSALGKKKHCRTFMISTDGYVRGGVLDDYLEMSKSILNGENKNSRTFPLLYHLDDKKELENRDMWEKANPSFRYLKNLQVVMDQEYIDMQTNAQLYTEFVTKRMNLPEGNQDKEVTSWENILATNQEVPNLEGATCRVGIDYAKTTDFVCAGLLFKYKEKYVWMSHSWVCKKSKDLKRIKAPLDEWEKQGFLTFVDEVEIHPDIPAEWLATQAEKYNLTILGMDNYRYTLLAKSLRKVGFDTDKKRTNNIKLTRPSDQMRIYPIINSAFTNQNIIFGDNPLMRWYTNNTCLHAEKYDNYTFAKIEPKSRKTDGFMAFVTAMCTDIDNLPDSAEVINYEDFGVYTY